MNGLPLPRQFHRQVSRYQRIVDEQRLVDRDALSARELPHPLKQKRSYIASLYPLLRSGGKCGRQRDRRHPAEVHQRQESDCQSPHRCQTPDRNASARPPPAKPRRHNADQPAVRSASDKTRETHRYQTPAPARRASPAFRSSSADRGPLSRGAHNRDPISGQRDEVRRNVASLRRPTVHAADPAGRKYRDARAVSHKHRRRHGGRTAGTASQLRREVAQIKFDDVGRVRQLLKFNPAHPNADTARENTNCGGNRTAGTNGLFEQQSHSHPSGCGRPCVTSVVSAPQRGDDQRSPRPPHRRRLCRS